MSTASEHLVRMTWMNEHAAFKNHDSFTPVKWDDVWVAMSSDEFTEHQMVLTAVLEFLCGSDMAEVSLDEIDRLPQIERLAVLEALKIRWPIPDLQEDF